MSPDLTPHKARFEQRLAERERFLEASLKALASDDEPAAVQQVSDFKDLAGRSAEADSDEHQADRLLHELAQVRAAQARLARGRYGVCAACGQALETRRLEALPEAELCLACQQNEERRRA